MCNKNLSRLFAFAAFATLLFASTLTLAQKSPDAANEVTGTGTKGDIPVFKGAHTIGNSIAKQIGTSTIEVSSGSGTAANTVFGNNTQTDGLSNGAGVYGQLSTTGQSITGSGFLFG